MFEIKSRCGCVLFRSEAAESPRDAVVDAMRHDVPLAAAMLAGMELSGVDFGGMDLSGADLSGADLTRANFEAATLELATMRGARLEKANLYAAHASGLILEDADLRGADLRWTTCNGTVFRGADLAGANMTRCDLYGADLRDVNGLDHAEGADLALAMVRIIPEGDVVGYKKCRDGKIAQLLILNGWSRTNGTGRACRSEAAIVRGIEGGFEEATSLRDPSLIYMDGLTTRPDGYDGGLANDGRGIHFYLTEAEARAFEYQDEA